MWPLPDIKIIKMHRIAHLLNELPLKMDRKDVSVEIKADSINRTKEFEMIMKNESLCFKSFPSRDHIFIYVGSEDYFKYVRFVTNQSLIVVPLTSENTKIPLSGKLEKIYKINGNNFFF